MNVRRIVAVCLWLSLGIALIYLTWLGPDWLEWSLLPAHFVTALSVLCHDLMIGLLVGLILPNLHYVAIRSFSTKILPFYVLDLVLLALLLSILVRKIGTRKAIFVSFIISWTASRLIEWVSLGPNELRRFPFFSVGLLLNMLLLPEVKKFLVKSSETERR